MWILEKKVFLRIDDRPEYIPVYYVTKTFRDWEDAKEKEKLKSAEKTSDPTLVLCLSLIICLGSILHHEPQSLIGSN